MLRIILTVLLVLALLGVFVPQSFGLPANGILLIDTAVLLCILMGWVPRE